jgi:hypothetical protein
MRVLAAYIIIPAIVSSALPSCNPKIYSFDVEPRSTGQSDSIRVSWKVRGNPTLLIHDIDYPNTGDSVLPGVTLLITRDGNTDAFLLRAADTLNLPLVSPEDSLVIRKKPDGLTSDRLQYITLVASRNGKEVPDAREVAIRPDSAHDEIGFRDAVKGDTLVAGGINSPKRWGDDFDILSVTDGSNRPMEVIHAGISRVLRPGDSPDEGFKGTPVQGYWMFRSLLTPEEKANLRLAPAALKINITIKHH